MPYVDHARREIRFKIVYYGPGLGGKTTNLECIHRRSAPSRRGKLIALNTAAERTLFFDLLPVELGVYRGYRVRTHLCTVPGQLAQSEMRRVVLRHVDGLVFVVDSQRARMAANQASLRDLRECLRAQGDDLDEVPAVVQYNKRDLPGAMSLVELSKWLPTPDHVPQQEASAAAGIGVFETLKLAIAACLDVVPDPRRAASGRSPSILPGIRSSMVPGAAPPGIQGVTSKEGARGREPARAEPSRPVEPPWAP